LLGHRSLDPGTRGQVHFAGEFPRALLAAGTVDPVLAWRDVAKDRHQIARGLIEDGRRHLLFGATIRSYCPTRILQGMRDPDVPYRHALDLVEHMAGDPVTLTLIKDGDHRLSRPQDLALILEAIDSFA